MEPESPGTLSGNTKNENASQSGGTRQKRRSTGNNSPKSKRVHRGRHSWHDTSQTEHGYATRRKSLEMSLRKPDVTEKDENVKEDLCKKALRNTMPKDKKPQMEEELCKIKLHEAILKLNKDVDVQACTMLDLVNQISSLAEEKNIMVSELSTKVAEDEEKIANLEVMLTERKIEIDSLTSEKGQLELIVKEEQDKFTRVDNQLKKALANAEKFARDMELHVNMRVHDPENLIHSKETDSIPNEDIDSKKEKSFPLEEENDLDLLLKDALGKIADLVNENKKLEGELHKYECNQLHLQKFNERFEELEGKFIENEAALKEVFDDQHLNDKFKVLFQKPLVGKNVDNKLIEQVMNDSNMTSDQDKNCVQSSIEEQLCSKIEILERIYLTSEMCSTKCLEEIERNSNLCSKINNLDSMFEELRVTISNAMEKNENLYSILEEERKKYSCLEFTLKEKEEELEMMKQKGCSTDSGNEVRQLIKRVADLNAEKLIAEEKEHKVQFELKSYKEELSALKIQLEECQRKVLSLTSSNDELQKLVISEKDLSKDLKNQLQVSLDKVESLTKEISVMSKEFRDREDELLKRLNEATSKIMEFGDEIHSKTQALENITVIVEEHKVQLEEERSNNKSLEERLSNLHHKETYENRVHSSVYSENDIAEIIFLKDQIDSCHFSLSKINPENNCVDGNCQDESISSSINSQLQPVLAVIEDVAQKMNQLSKKLKGKVPLTNESTDVVSQVADPIQLAAQSFMTLESIKEESFDRTASEFVEVNLYEQVHIKQERLSVGESMEMSYREDAEYSTALSNTSLSNETTQEQTALVDVQGKILSLEEELANTRLHLDKIMADKNEFELLFKNEAVKVQNYEKDLKNALNEIDILSKKILEANSKEKEISSQLSQEIEKCKQLEEELEASEVVVANLAESEEECILQLKEMIEHKMSLEEKLQIARETIEKLTEESDQLKNVVDVKENEKQTSELGSKEEIMRLNDQIQSQLQEIDEINRERENIISESNMYKERIAELEKIVEEKISLLSKLNVEKGELENLLCSEKESYQKAISQLSEVSAHHEEMSSKITDYETKISELNEIIARNEVTISSLGAEKAEVESLLVLEKENVQKLNSQLHEASIHLESLEEKFTVFDKMVLDIEKLSERKVQFEKEIAILKENEAMHKAELASSQAEKARLDSLLIVENETSQQLNLKLSEASEDLEKLSVKIQEYERKISDSEELIIANESAMFKLTSEKEELELKLASEKNRLNLTPRLSITPPCLENSPTFAKTDAEELASLLYAEIQKVEKLEKEIEVRKEELLQIKNREQELIALLDAEKSRNGELKTKLSSIQDEKNETDVSNNLSSASGKDDEDKASNFEKLSKKVLELEDVIVRLHIEKEELESVLVSEKGNSRRVSSQLNEALLDLESISKELSQKYCLKKEAEELHNKVESKSQEIDLLRQDMYKKEIECEELRERLNQLRTEEIRNESEIKMTGSEDPTVANVNAEVSIEKNEIETSEKETEGKTGSSLTDTSGTLGNITPMIKSRNPEEFAHLEEMLKAEKEKVENLSTQLEDVTLALLQEKSKYEELQERIQCSRSDTSFRSTHEHSDIDGDFCNHATSLEKISAYERKIVELEDTVSNHASEITKLCGEKVELESLLAQEKENRRKIYSELNVALINLDNVAERINEQAGNNKDVKELSSLLENEMQKVKELEERLESKEEDLENLVSKLDELSGRLHEENSREMLSRANMHETLTKEFLVDTAEERILEVSCKAEVPSEESSGGMPQTEKTLLESENRPNKEVEIMTMGWNEAFYLLQNASGAIKSYEKMMEEMKQQAHNESMGISKLMNEEEANSVLETDTEKPEICNQLSVALESIQNATEKFADYKRVICRLIEMSGNNSIEISKFFSEKSVNESQQGLEKDKFSNISLEYNDTVAKLEGEVAKVKAYEKLLEEMKLKEDMNSHEILRLEEGKAELEAKLNVEKENLKNSSFREKETLSSLKTQSEILLSYESTIDRLRDLSERNAIEIASLSKEKQQMELKLTAEQDKYMATFNQLSITSSELEDLSEKIPRYEKEIEELKISLSARNAELSNLNQEKGEVEVQLELQKEKLQKSLYQLSELEIRLQNESAKEASFEKLVEEMKQQLDSYSIGISNLEKEKKELESQLCEAKEKYEHASFRLSEALSSLESQHELHEKAIKELNDAVEMKASEISQLLQSHHEMETQLNDEKERFIDVSNQLTEALSNLEKETAKCERLSEDWKLSTEMNASEVPRLCQEKNEIESQLREEREKLQEASTELNEAKHAIKEWMDTAAKNATEISSLLQEKSELEVQLNTEKERLQSTSHQLSEALTCLENESAKYQKIIQEWKVAAEMRACEISRLNQEKNEIESQLKEERDKLQEVSTQLGEAKHAMKEWMDTTTKNATEISSLLQEKNELEVQLNTEKERLQSTSHQLSKALTCLENESTKYQKIAQEWKDAAEMRVCEISRLIQEKNEIEQLLIDEREKVHTLTAQLDEASTNFESLSSRHEIIVKELKDAIEMNASEVSRLSKEKDETELQLINEKESLNNATDQLREALAAMENESVKYEQVIREWKDAAEMRAFEIMRLNKLKDEMESQLNLEKEIAQNATTQLKNAEIKIETLSSKQLENEASIKHLNEQLEINSTEISKLRMEKEENEAQLILARENLEKITSELNEALINLESEASKVSAYEKDIQVLNEQAELKVSEIGALVRNKEDVESQLIQERENSQDLSKRLNEALVTIENLTKELNFSYSNDKKAEELSILLRAEAEKVKQIEEELAMKDEKLNEYQESQIQLLHEATNKVAELEEELKKQGMQSEEFSAEVQNQKTILESKDVEIKDLIAKVSFYEEEVKRLSDLETLSTTKISEHAAAISGLELMIEESKGEILTLVSRGEELESQLLLEKENSEKLNLNLQDAIVKIETLSKDIISLSDECNNKEQEIENNRSAMEKLAEKYNWELSEGTRFFEVMEDELDKFLTQISHLNSEKELLNAKKVEDNEHFSKEVERLMALVEDRETQLSSLTIENDELKVNVIDKGKRLITIQDQLDSALQEIETITHKLNELSSKLDMSQKNESETFKAMKAEVEGAKCALSESLKNEKELTNLLESEKSKVEKLNAQLSEIEISREEIVLKNQELAESVNAMSQQLHSVMKDYEKSSENELNLMDMNEKLLAESETLKSKLTTYESEINRLETEISKKSSETSDFENKAKEFSEQMECIETLLKESKSQLSLLTSERERLDEDLQLKDVQLRDTQNQLTNAQQEVEDLKLKLEEASMNLRNKEVEGSSIMKSLREELEATKYALSVCATSEEELDNSLKVEKDRVNSLTKQLSEEKYKIEELSSKNLELSNTLECVNGKMAAMLEKQIGIDEREKHLKAMNEEMSAELEKLKTSMSSSESELVSLKEELLAKAEIVFSLESKNSELLRDSESLKDIVNERKNEINILREENNNLLVKVDSKSKEMESILEQLNSAKQTIDSLKTEVSEVRNELESSNGKESEKMKSMRSELEELKLALEAHSKQEDELNVLLIAEKSKADELNRILKEEMFKAEDAINKNKELTTSIQMLEQQLTIFLEESKTRNEKETSHLATVKELKEKVKNLEDGLYSAKVTNDSLQAEIQVKSNKIAISENKNQELLSLVESGNVKISKLEVSLKEMNEKLMSKEKNMAQMQNALEKAESDVTSLVSETELLKKNKENENILRGKVRQLEGALRESKETIKRISEANVLEIERVKRSSMEGILEMKERMNTVNRELSDVKRMSEIRISSLQKEVNLEKEKYEKKTNELTAMQLNNAELSKDLESMKSRVVGLEQRLSKEKEKAVGYEQKLDAAKTEIRRRTLEIHRMKAVEDELKSHLEIGRKKAVMVEGELAQVRASLLSSNLKQDELKSEILQLEAKVKQEAEMAKQLGMQLEMERMGQQSSKEAEKQAHQVIATQEKALAVLKSREGSVESNAEVQLLKSQTEEKDRQIEIYKRELMRCKEIIKRGPKGQMPGVSKPKLDIGVQTTLDDSSKSQGSEVQVLHKKINQLENDKEFLKELCRRRHKQREDLKKELAALTGQSTSKPQPANKENVNFNV